MLAQPIGNNIPSQIRVTFSLSTLSIWPPFFFIFRIRRKLHQLFVKKKNSSNLNPMDNSSGESIFFFWWVVWIFFCGLSCGVVVLCLVVLCPVDQGSGSREMPAKRANKPPTNCEVDYGGCQSHGASIASISRWTKGPGIILVYVLEVGQKMKRTPPSYTGLQVLVCIHVFTCSCVPSDKSPAIPEDRADHTDTRMAL